MYLIMSRGVILVGVNFCRGTTFWSGGEVYEVIL